MSGYEDDSVHESYKTYGGACDPSPDDLFITAERDRAEFTKNRENAQHGELLNDHFE